MANDRVTGASGKLMRDGDTRARETGPLLLSMSLAHRILRKPERIRHQYPWRCGARSAPGIPDDRVELGEHLVGGVTSACGGLRAAEHGRDAIRFPPQCGLNRAW